VPRPLPSVTGEAVALPCALAAAAQSGPISIMILAAISMRSALGYGAVISGLTPLPLTIALAGRLSGRSPAACPAAPAPSRTHGAAIVLCPMRAQRFRMPYRVEAQHVQRHPPDNGRQPPGGVLDLARFGAAEPQPGR
jgi:hypothetical protein